MDAFSKQLVKVAPSLALDYWSGEKSVAALAPKCIRNVMLTNVDMVRHVLKMDEAAVYAQIHPSPILNMVRYRFWELLEQCAARQQVMDEVSIYQGITDRDTFMEMISTLGSLSWILRPPINKTALMTEAYEVIVNKLRHFLDQPLTLHQTLQIYKVLDTKLHGAPVKNIHMRTENKNLNLNAQLDSKPQSPAELMTEAELEQEIMRVRQSAARATFTAAVVDDE